MKLNKEIQRLWNAVAHSSGAGTPEVELASSKPGTPSGNLVSGSPIDNLPALKPGQQIGLYLGSELLPEVMHYVNATCVRLSPRLAVLTFQSEPDARALLKPYQAELDDAHINVQLTVLGGEPPAALIQALRKRPEIAFLICNESGYLGRGLKKGIVRQEAFPVPVVMAGAYETTMVKPVQAPSNPAANHAA